jgi:DNA-binding HxlR family transcriptional regulator
MPTAIANSRFEGTGYSYTLSLIQGKHKMAILYCLMEFQPVRFNEMRRYLGGVADKTLSANLKELERDGLVERKEYPQVPPKVEYSLTPLGESLMEVLDRLCIWGEEHMPKEKRMLDNQR